MVCPLYLNSVSVAMDQNFFKFKQVLGNLGKLHVGDSLSFQGLTIYPAKDPASVSDLIVEQMQSLEMSHILGS